VNSISGIKKYYIGFGVLIVLMLACVAYVFSQAGSAKADKLTDKTVEQISSKLEINIADKGIIPGSLEEAGIKDPAPTVKYTRLDDTKYKVCIEYKTGSNGFDAGWGSLLLGGALNQGFQPESNPDKTYFDSTVQFSHKKGQNCQTVTPYLYGSGYSGDVGLNFNKYSSASSVCENPAQGLASGDLTVSRVDSASKTIYFESANQYVYDKSGNQVPTIGSKQYSDTTIFCNGKDLSLTNISAIKAGDQVTVFLKSTGDNTLSQVNTTYLFGN
jgi:hypothetical protein